jgi:hypothetical protein
MKAYTATAIRTTSTTTPIITGLLIIGFLAGFADASAGFAGLAAGAAVSGAAAGAAASGIGMDEAAGALETLGSAAGAVCVACGSAGTPAWPPCCGFVEELESGFIACFLFAFKAYTSYAILSWLAIMQYLF